MTYTSGVSGCWLGLCRKIPVIHASAAMVPDHAWPACSLRPHAGGNPGSPGRVRQGISVAAGSIRELFRDRQLVWFSLLSGITILVLVLAEQWNLANADASIAASGLLSIVRDG